MWELLDGNCTERTHRLRVAGGWLYRHQRIALGMQQPPATITFVPTKDDAAQRYRKTHSFEDMARDQREG